MSSFALLTPFAVWALACAWFAARRNLKGLFNALVLGLPLIGLADLTKTPPTSGTEARLDMLWYTLISGFVILTALICGVIWIISAWVQRLRMHHSKGTR